ncbi:MAG TPA: antitoxin Xre-like helix-turn-helix domain-containing protein [Terracidiphilus sp.]|jgi:putative toxin-antitoxin system antitoxin component (TIGR02293 family)|nr:antitoxin Xre-like helix-turn-helix domain-containing protein [Terracidiphilus sp.]
MAHALVVYTPPDSTFAYDWQAVERGVPLSALEEFSAHSGFPVKALLDVVIPARTLKHRRQRNEPLSIEEADRLRRVARTYELTLKVFGSPADARQWMTARMRRFEDRMPMALLRTQAGEEAVQEALIQIDEGMYI